MTMHDNDRLFDTLLSKYLTREISGEETEKLFSLVMQSPSRKERFEKAAGVNALLRAGIFDSHKEADYALLKERNVIRPAVPVRRFAWLRRIAAAAALVAVSSAGSIYIYSNHLSEEELSWIETSTPLGGQTRLVLPDGTVAWVNAKSELRYSSGFGSTDREIYLEGEGYFEVAKNERLPFCVHAGDMTATATGTQFNVSSYPDDDKWEIDLLEGGVDVALSGKSFSLSPDEKIIYDRAAGEAVVEQIDANMAVQWTKGKLSFFQASIPEIYRMLERHFNVCIEIGSEELKKEFFLGSINLEMSLSGILSYLDVDKKYRVEVKNDIIIVKNR